MVTGKLHSCREVAEKLIVRLDAEYEQLCRGASSPLERRWKSRLGLVGSQVEMQTGTGWYSGILRDLSFGGLELRSADNQTHVVAPESVVLLRSL